MVRALVLVMAGVIALTVPSPASGQGAFPSRPIQIVVPYPPGGTSDLQVRVLQEPLRRILGQPIVVDNRPGAAGALATRQVARATPDGHTLLFPNNALVITPSLSRDAGYHPIKDLAPVSLVSLAPMLLVVHPSVPANSVRELIEYAKANPGKLEYATAGHGSFGHLATELFSKAAGIRMLHVPYKGQAPATLAVLSGEVKVLMTTTSSAMNTHIKEGKVRLLGVSSLRPSPLAPGAVPIAATVPNFSTEVWFGVFAPAGTPADVIGRLNAALAEALATPEIRDRFAGFGVTATSSTPAQLAERVAREYAEWESVIRAADIKAE
jgi:tripartite-type tricarboxylate transporter receptor subunit TctC